MKTMGFLALLSDPRNYHPPVGNRQDEASLAVPIVAAAMEFFLGQVDRQGCT